MENFIKEQFIILRKLKYGEADLIIHGLSTAGAKKSFIARSALKSKKRFGGGILEPLHFVNLTYKPTKSGTGLNILTEAVLIDDFKLLRTDYDRLEVALCFLNCAYHVSQEGDESSQFLFNLMGHALRELGTTSHIRRFKLHFYLKFMYQQGVISLESWMTPFLKITLSESNQLDSLTETSDLCRLNLETIEAQVMQYLKTADTANVF